MNERSTVGELTPSAVRMARIEFELDARFHQQRQVANRIAWPVPALITS